MKKKVVNTVKPLPAALIVAFITPAPAKARVQPGLLSIFTTLNLF